MVLRKVNCLIKKKIRKKKLFESVMVMYPIIQPLILFLSECYSIFDYNDIGAFHKFLVKYKDSNIDSIAQYVNGLIKDYIAVRNSLVYPKISNGPTEGRNSRIKMLHRRSGGRAKLELLNAYSILSG